MPTYEYVCTACGHDFELVQKMTDPPRKRCPRCRSKVERKIGAGAGLIFKGSGFYTTDYRSKEYKDKAKADSQSVSDKKAGDSSKKKDSPDSSSSTPKSDGGTKAAKKE